MLSSFVGVHCWAEFIYLVEDEHLVMVSLRAGGTHSGGLSVHSVSKLLRGLPDCHVKHWLGVGCAIALQCPLT